MIFFIFHLVPKNRSDDHRQITLSDYMLTDTPCQSSKYVGPESADLFKGPEEAFRIYCVSNILLANETMRDRLCLTIKE